MHSFHANQVTYLTHNRSYMQLIQNQHVPNKAHDQFGTHIISQSSTLRSHAPTHNQQLVVQWSIAPIATNSTLPNIAEDSTTASTLGDRVSTLSSRTDSDIGPLSGIAVVSVDHSSDM